MAVIHPIKLIIDNYPSGKREEFDVENNPQDESAGTRKVPFSREVYIESEDFMEVPAPKYFRLYPGNEVRLKSAYIVKCKGCDKRLGRQCHSCSLRIRRIITRRQPCRRA